MPERDAALFQEPDDEGHVFLVVECETVPPTLEFVGVNDLNHTPI